MIERSFPRHLDALGSIFEFVRTVFELHGISTDHSFEVDLIIEELFTNMVRHSSGGRHEIPIAIGWEGSILTIILRDRDVEEFDVAAAPKVDVGRPAREREAGGLGLHLVHKIADGVSYRYADRTSTITIVKRLER